MKQTALSLLSGLNCYIYVIQVSPVLSVLEILITHTPITISEA